uniref:MFS domain-containing protein n=1 Tax=Panagrellus redivivus TaxID=6233 RepID=A0A7E4VWI2_PANRE
MSEFRYYTGDIIKSAGVKNNHTIIWLSAVVSSFNFFASLIPIFFIERIGRRKILIGSTIGVVIALLMMGGSFLVVNRDTALVGTDFPKPTTHISNFDHCASYSNCDYCVTDESCGFCSPNIGDTSTPGACLPVSNTYPDDYSSFGACASNANASTFEWRSKFCTTKYTMLPLVVMVIYLICFASGLTTAPWVLNAEIYPLWARSTCVGASTATNWMFNLLISATFLTLSEAITKYGTFFLYAFLTSIGVVIFVFFVPETKNKSLVEIEELFKMRRNQMKTTRKPKLILTTDVSGCPDYGKVVKDSDLLRF